MGKKVNMQLSNFHIYEDFFVFISILIAVCYYFLFCKDALTKFKLHYAKAQLKAKDSSKIDEAYDEYCMALLYE